MKSLNIIFIRAEGIGHIETLRVASVETRYKTEGDTLDAIDRALSSWMEKTVAGKKAWEESVDDFNVGDLFMHINKNGNAVSSLAVYLKREGIGKIKDLLDVGNSSVFEFDKRLGHPDFD
jgi:hypothetical protein